MSTIVVTGASGFVGSHVVPHLIASGHRVVAPVRNEAAADLVRGRLAESRRAALECRPGDVDRPETLPAALAGADAVVHLAALPRDWNGGRDLARVNTEGTRHVLDAARAAGVRRFVHLGALGVADDPTLHYASSKARAERLVAESGLDWTILKPSLLWGPGDGFFNILADLVRISPGVMPITGSGASRFQPLSVDDLARVVGLCLERPETIGGTYELGGPRVWTYREIAAEVLAGMGRRRILVPMPVAVIRLVAGTAEAIHLPFPVATDQLRQLRLDNVGPIDGVEGGFGFAPTPMEGRLGYLRLPRARQLAPDGRAGT